MAICRRDDSAHETELDKLHAELERIAATDFFEARGRAAATMPTNGAGKLRTTLMAYRQRQRTKKGDVLDPSQFQGRRWVTRRNLHIDRLASAWLIRQFIDKRPRFYFVAEGETIEGSVPFDMFGAEFTHQGEDCTFETLLKRFGLGDDPGLRELAEIVHDIDLKDGKFNRLEAAGLDGVVRGLGALLNDDRKLLRQSSAVFDGLYALLGKDTPKDKGGKDVGRKQTGGHAGKRVASKSRR